MATKQKSVLECKCERCKHEWITRGEDIPSVCPKCKSPYWNKPKKKATK